MLIFLPAYYQLACLSDCKLIVLPVYLLPSLLDFCFSTLLFICLPDYLLVWLSTPLSSNLPAYLPACIFTGLSTLLLTTSISLPFNLNRAAFMLIYPHPYPPASLSNLLYLPALYLPFYLPASFILDSFIGTCLLIYCQLHTWLPVYLPALYLPPYLPAIFKPAFLSTCQLYTGLLIYYQLYTCFLIYCQLYTCLLIYLPGLLCHACLANFFVVPLLSASLCRANIVNLKVFLC